MQIIQKVLILNKILDLSHTSHLCMGLTSIEIKTDIWIGFTSFIRNGSVLPPQKYSAKALLSGQELELFEQLLFNTLLII